VLTYEEEAEEIPRSEEDSRRTVNHVNEDDEKLKNSTIEEKDRMIVMIIGGVKIFLPSDRGEASTDVADATEGQQNEVFMGEKEHILMFVPTEGEHPVELLTRWELELKELEDWLDGPELGGGFHNIAMLEETHQHEE
jgi:hypothetical protein